MFTDNVVTHILSGLGAGFIAVCVGSPVDVVRISPLIGFQILFFIFQNEVWFSTCHIVIAKKI
jgi:hypothetical protein